MNMSLEEYFHDFRQNLLTDAEARGDFLEAEFTLSVAKELEDSGAIEGFELCQYKAPKAMRIDGYWRSDDGLSLNLFITDFSGRADLEPLTKTEAAAIFRRAENFFTASAEKNLYAELEETSPGYGLARDIAERAKGYRQINFYLLSERRLSDKADVSKGKEQDSWLFTHNIWDIGRLHRISTSKNIKEELIINFPDKFGTDIPCLPANIASAEYESFLMVMPGKILSELYGEYGDRLLEQNVRCFLQARGKVNKGIRATIINDPEMFFAYNNGITATAKEVIIAERHEGRSIAEIRDFQIVNGGQTTASLFYTGRKDKASLEKVFVQMKLSVIDSKKSEQVVPYISEYANTQNKVNAADFFSNHPFHIRMEEFSRRLWAPAAPGAGKETKWFYERARGQYADAQAKTTSKTEKKRFLAEFPKTQMFSKTDLAKYENVWDDRPVYVNYGAQKNFAHYARRIGCEWSKSPDKFSEFYFKRVIARAIVFKFLEKLISRQSWYNGGYRANIVAYTLAMISRLCTEGEKAFDFQKIWDLQAVDEITTNALQITAKFVHDDIMKPAAGISNISEWCKKEACWDRLKTGITKLKELLPVNFFDSLSPIETTNHEVKAAAKLQKLDNGIEAQKQVYIIPGQRWKIIMEEGNKRHLFTPKEVKVLQIAVQIPRKIPSAKQSIILLEILNKVRAEGLAF